MTKECQRLHGTTCRFCGARLKKDGVGHYCPTRNCQNQYGVRECQIHLHRATPDPKQAGELRAPTDIPARPSIAQQSGRLPDSPVKRDSLNGPETPATPLSPSLR